MPSIARRTKGATWCVNERTPLSQVRDRVCRHRPVLPPRRQHARGGAGEARDAKASLRPPLDRRHWPPHAPAGEGGPRPRLLPLRRGARLALPGAKEAGRRGHVVRLPRPRGAARARRGDQGALPQARHRPELGGAAATRGRARHAPRPPECLSHPPPRRIRGWADLSGHAVPEGRAALGPRGEGWADGARRRDRRAASGVRRAASRARAPDRAPRPEAREHHARDRGQRSRAGRRHGLRPRKGAPRRSGDCQAHRHRHHPRHAGIHESRADSGQTARRPLRHLRPRHRRLRNVHGQAAIPGAERTGDDDRPAARPAAEAAAAPVRSLRRPGERVGPGDGSEPRRALQHRARIRRRAHRVPHRRFPVEDQGEAEIRRFPAFDPPEYVEWKPDPALVRAFRETIERDPERAAVVAGLAVETRLGLYAGLLRARLHDIQLKRWVRTGVISKAWLGTGEEATTVGPVHALERGRDVVAPMIRNAAACCELGLPVSDMLRAYLGSEDSPARGRDLPRLPGNVQDWAASYGIAGAAFDGNNVLDAYAATRVAAERCRRGDGPALLVAETFRMGGHATHDEREARDTFPAALFEHWGKRDPIGMYEEYLKADGITVKQLAEIEAAVTAEVERAAEAAVQSREKLPPGDRKSTRLNSRHSQKSYAGFC